MGNPIGEFVTFPFALGTMALFFGARFWVTSQNQKQDVLINSACEELSRSTNGQVAARYRTMYVGFCKPKGAQPFRAIALSPVGAVTQMGMAAPVAQTMQVQVPEGVNPG